MTGEETKWKNTPAKRKVEILSPAGSYTAFQAALSAGADAVYAGGNKYGARAFAVNFTEEELIDAIGEAHLYGKKFYLTVNTLLKDEEVSELGEYLSPLYEAGLDAVIVQDVGVMEDVKIHFPDLDIHVSTQATVTGVYGAKLLEHFGVTRVVPARELSLEEIRAIHDQTGLEIECFVHGALCYCYSGQCLLSSMIGGRSGNRGQCAQPCRLPYTFDGGKKKYYLSPKDICALEIVPDLIEAGIHSFKIEGRMKKPEYVAAVTSLYRKYVDLYFRAGRKGYQVSPADKKALMDLYNRGGFTQGYYKEHNGRSMMALDHPGHAGVPAVKVRSQKGREIQAEALISMNPGDVIEVTGGKGNYTLGQRAEKGAVVSFLVNKDIHIRPGTILSRIRNESLIQKVTRQYLRNALQVGITGIVTVSIGSPVYLTVSFQKSDGEILSFTAQTSQCVMAAQNQPMDEERIRDQIQKTGDTGFYFKKLDVYIDENVFLPVGQLNQLRRSALDGLEDTIRFSYTRHAPYNREGEKTSPVVTAHQDNPCEDGQWAPVLSVLAETEEQLCAVRKWIRHNPDTIRRLYIDLTLVHRILDPVSGDGGERTRSVFGMLKEISDAECDIFLAMPSVFRAKKEDTKADLQKILGIYPLNGVLIRNIEEYSCLRDMGFDKKMVLDHNLYVFNQYGKQFWKNQGVWSTTAPVELNARELSILDIRQSELIVYGNLPVMTSAQCIKKTAGNCDGRSEIKNLVDRYGNSFPVKNFCDSCFNVIYNSRPLYLGKHMEEIRRLSPAMLRLQFTTEEEKKTLEIIGKFWDIFSGRGDNDFSWGEYTHGHFKRGVS